MHKPDFRLSARRLRSPAIGLVILTLLCQRLLDTLPVTDSAAWMINDALRAVSFAALTWLAYLLTPFDWLRGKWLMAATLGADVAVCVAWHTLRAGGHKTAILDMLVGTRWRLIGTNCLTLLAWRWREDYRVR